VTATLELLGVLVCFTLKYCGILLNLMDLDDLTPMVDVLTIRCMRCACTTEVTSTDDLTDSGMVRVSQNLYYCLPCAMAVGFLEKDRPK